MLTVPQAEIAHVAMAIGQERWLAGLEPDECASVQECLLGAVMIIGRALNRQMLTTDAPVILNEAEMNEVQEHDRAIASILSRAWQREGGGNA